MKTAQIFIYDYIGHGGYSSKDFANDIKDFADNGVDKVEVYINSPGGDVFEGFTMFNHLKGLDADAIIMGQAASIASVIASGCNKIYMHKNARYLIHNPSTFAWGDQKEMEKRKDELDNIKDSIIDAYSRKTSLEKDEIVQMMDDETTMTADEALEKGFVDEVIEQEEEKNYAPTFINYIDDNKNYNKKDKKMNERLLNFFGLTKKSTEAEQDIKLTEFKNEFGLDEKATIADVITKMQEKNTDGDATIESLRTDITQMQNTISTLTKDKTDAAEAQKLEDATNLVTNAISDKKILPADKEIWLNNAITDFDATKKQLDAKEKDSAIPKNMDVNYKQVDMNDATAISNAAKKYVAEQAEIGNVISVAQAVNHVTGGKKEQE